MTHASNAPTEDHFLRLIRLLDLEAEAEKQEILRNMARHPGGAEASGSTLLHLVVRQQDSGMGGRILLTLGKRNQTLPLPWTRLDTGSPVILSEETDGKAGQQGWRGTVSRLQKETIEVAFTQWPESESENPTYRLDHSTDEISRQRQRQALEKARSVRESCLAVLRDVLLGKLPPSFHKTDPPEPLDGTLNESQTAAVNFALSADDIAIIHGPPGTGKTTTLVELIRQITRSGQSVLAVAPSNLAVDNLLEKLLAAGEHALRLGHPARVQPELRQHTLDEMVKNHPELHLADRLMHDAYALRTEASRYRRARPDPGYRQALRQEANRMLDEARKIEEQVVQRLLASAHVVCATNTGLDHELLRSRTFDWCIMDEASQSTEPSVWIPLQYVQRLVLAGDHFQLPPTVISTRAIAEGFNISMLERLEKETGKTISRQLDVQYRMHAEIMAFSSSEFYESSLVPHPSVARHLLSGLPGVSAGDLTGTAVHFIDTAGASYDEESDPDGDSHFNPLEADLVIRKTNELLEAGLSPEQIAVITPYSAQVRLLRQRMKHPGIEIDSVDGFQGREKEAVLVSLVRSNPEGEIGFLGDVRRMNVALTRARRKLIVVGDSATISVHPFDQRLLAYFETIQAYHSVWEEIN